MSETSMNPTEAVKLCPECSASISKTASLCRHCGYIYPLGKAAATGATSQRVAQSNTRSPVRDWVKIAAPVVIILVVLALASWFYVQNRVTSTWVYAMQHLSAQSAYDSSFESWLQGWFLRSDQLAATALPRAVTVNAAGGTCLLRFPQGNQPGLVARMGVKMVAMTFAGMYAAYRHQHGDEPVAQCVVFNGDRRLVAGTFDGRKHPEVLAGIEGDFSKSMKYSSPEAMMADYYDRMRREFDR